MENIFKHYGVKIGHAHDADVKTGVTIIIPDRPRLCAVDVRGGGPGTREISALQDGGLIEHIHAISLSGGSVYGLAAADAATNWLGAQGRGYVARADIPVSPIVPSAILFDNANGGAKNWGQRPPFYDLGLSACEAARYDSAEGTIGAGYGATAGCYSGGFGIASELINGVHVTALIAANPVGSPYMPASNVPWAWPYEEGREFGGRRPAPDYALSPALDTKLALIKAAGQATVIGAVITDAALTQKQAKRLAIMAQDGLAMSVQPAHTPLDGDTIFALSAGEIACNTPVALAELGGAAARCTARALMRGVYHAAS
jgi:D-aminopeptidase